MTKKLLIPIVAVSLAGAIILISEPAKSVKSAPLTFAERDEVIALYNYELSKLGPVTLTGVTSGNVLLKLNEKIFLRAETKDVVIKGKLIQQKNYAKYRSDLLTKAVTAGK